MLILSLKGLIINPFIWINPIMQKAVCNKYRLQTCSWQVNEETIIVNINVYLVYLPVKTSVSLACIFLFLKVGHVIILSRNVPFKFCLIPCHGNNL